MKEFLTLLFGTSNVPLAIVGSIYLLIGILLNLLIGATKRDVDSSNTPKQFDWNFFIRDNWKRALTSFIAALMVIRFLKIFYPEADLSNDDSILHYCLFIGLGIDNIVDFVKNKVLTIIPSTPK